MKRTVALVVAGSVVSAVASVAISWKLMSRRVVEVRDETEAFGTTNARAIDDVELELHEVRERIDTLEVASVRKTVVETAKPVAVRAPRPTAPARAPSANWWCYFGRECFRSQDDCFAGDAKRVDECKPQQSAWCGGVDGKSCFATDADCIELDSQVEAPLMLGAAGDRPRPCVEVR